MTGDRLNGIGQAAYQCRRDFGGKMFLVRVMVDDGLDPAGVVTAYRTSKIERYWKNP